MAQIKKTCYYLFRGNDDEKSSVEIEKYDTKGNMVSKNVSTDDSAIAEILNSFTSYEYDSLGNVTNEEQKGGDRERSMFKYKYDNKARVVNSVMSYFMGTKHWYDNTYDYKYDSLGNKILEFDGNQGTVDLWQYNALKEKIGNFWFGDFKMQNTMSQTIYQYDSIGRLIMEKTKMNDGRKSEEHYYYDEHNRLIKDVDGDVTTTWEYNRNGLPALMKKIDSEMSSHSFKRTYEYTFY